MGKLQFPTQAEQALKEFETAGKTASLARIAKKRGAEREQEFGGPTTYTFDDDTSLVVRGRGRSYRVEALLP